MAKKDTVKSIRIFISHSSKDSELALSLIQLLKAAFNLLANNIRCTSVEGYKLSTGVVIEEQLKTEVHESEVLIALITPN